MEGEDAENFVRKRGKLDERAAWGLIRQAAAGLAHAAEMAIVHRDIKPSNLLLVTAPAGYPIPAGLPMVKIADFGLAYLAHASDQETRLTTDGTVVGSPNYLAPEQLEDRPLDYRTAMYALGATAFQMLTGKPPFSNKSLPQIIAAKLEGQGIPAVDAPAELSPASRDLLGWMMARDPGRRPGNYQELIEAIDVLTSSQTTTTEMQVRAPRAGGIAALPSPASGVDSSQSADGAESPTPSPSRSRFRSRALAMAAIILGVALPLAYVGYCLLLALPDAPPARDRALVATGWEQPLFDGRSVGLRRGLSGFWKQGKDDEGGAILIGENGLLPFEFPSVREGQRQPPQYYRLTLQVRLPAAQRVDVRFGLSRNDDRYPAIRIEPNSVAAGVADASGGWKTAGERAISDLREKFHLLQIERQLDAWCVFWDEAELAVLPYSEETHRPEFQLFVVGGAAWFSDLLVEEL